jgi:drug/metabolite transporter (DMT)-like permease
MHPNPALPLAATTRRDRAVMHGARKTPSTMPVRGRMANPVGIAFSLGALASLVTGTILFKKLDPAGGLLFGIAVQNLAGGAIAIPLALTFESI